MRDRGGGGRGDRGTPRGANCSAAVRQKSTRRLRRSGYPFNSGALCSTTWVGSHLKGINIINDNTGVFFRFLKNLSMKCNVGVGRIVLVAVRVLRRRERRSFPVPARSGGGGFVVVVVGGGGAGHGEAVLALQQQRAQLENMPGSRGGERGECGRRRGYAVRGQDQRRWVNEEERQHGEHFALLLFLCLSAGFHQPGLPDQ